MSLYKRISLNINDYTGTLTKNIKFYVNDCLDLIFTIKSPFFPNCHQKEKSIQGIAL